VIDTKNQSQKIQSRNIIIAITFPLFLGFITEIFLPFNNINVPPLTTIFSTLSAIIIGYTIVKHRLMSPNIFSIKTKLTTAIMIIIILFGVVGVISVYQSKQILTDIIGENASISVVESMDKIEIATLDRLEEWQHFTDDETLKNNLLLSNKIFLNIGTDEEILSYIQEINDKWINATYNDNFPFVLELVNNNLSKKLLDKIYFHNSKYNFSLFGEVFLTNKYGAVIALTNKTTDYYQADENWWQEAKDNGLFIDEVSHDESANIYSIDLIIRIDDEEDQFLGILKVVWNIKEIEQIINESLFKNDINQDDIVFTLLDGQGRIVYSTDYFKFLEKNLELFANIEYNSEMNKKYFIMDSENNSKTLISFAFSDGYKTLDRLDLILLYEFNENVIFVPYFTLRNNIYLITVLISIIALIIGLFISHYFTKPILKLKEYTEIISKGKYDIDIKMKESKDEIGSLALSFKDMTQKIKNYNNELKNLVDQKNEFVNQLGHDLKNPLNPLVNLIPLLEKTENDSNKKEMLKVVNRNVGYMKNLVTNILELARLNSPGTKFKIEETNLLQELNKVINSNELILNEKKIRIINNIPDNIQVFAVIPIPESLTETVTKSSSDLASIIILPDTSVYLIELFNRLLKSSSILSLSAKT
jgi:signal transduction histidine kinase